MSSAPNATAAAEAASAAACASAAAEAAAAAAFLGGRDGLLTAHTIDGPHPPERTVTGEDTPDKAGARTTPSHLLRCHERGMPTWP